MRVLEGIFICWCFASGICPAMVHDSRDLGRIISIVIPETPGGDINIDQLTSDFKHELQRISQQSRAPLRQSLMTLKNIGMTELKSTSLRDESLQQRPEPKCRFPKQNMPALRHPLRAVSLPNSRKFIVRQGKNVGARGNGKLRWEASRSKYPSSRPRTRASLSQRKNLNENFPSRPFDMTSGGWKSSDSRWRQRDSIGSNGIPDARSLPCSSGSGFKIRNPKEVRLHDLLEGSPGGNPCTNDIGSDGQTRSSCLKEPAISTPEIKELSNQEDVKEPIIYPINVEIEDLRAIDKILQNPQDILDLFNTSVDATDADKTKPANTLSGENVENGAMPTPVNQEGSRQEVIVDLKDPSFFQFNERSDMMSEPEVYSPRVADQLNFDDNFNIRVQRSVVFKSLKPQRPRESHMMDSKPTVKERELFKIRKSRKT